MTICGAKGTDTTLWTRLAPQMDRALERLRPRQRDAVLLCAFLDHKIASAAKVLRTSERRVEKRVGRGMNRLARRLRKRRAPIDPCAATAPEVLSLDILQSVEASQGKRPSLKLARRTLRSLAWGRWRRRSILGAVTLGVLLAIAGGVIWHVPPGRTWLFAETQMWMARYWNLTTAEAARPWPANAAAPQFDARPIRNAEQLYRTTNIWPVHLTFTRAQWEALEPKRVKLLANFILPDHRILLRNPEARRSGILGVMGREYDWSQAECEFGQVVFTNVATRVKGMRAGEPVAGKIYYPHPETKPEHFQQPDVLELLLPFVGGLKYGDEIQLSIPAEQMNLEATNS